MPFCSATFGLGTLATSGKFCSHLFGELYPFNRDLEPKSGFEKAIVKFWNDLPDFIIPVIMECRMYHKELMYAGTLDILLT